MLDGVDSAKTVEELKKSVLLATQWKEAIFAKRKFLFGLTSDGDGESYIDLHGWIYNRSFKEWRRILKINTRRIGSAELVIDEQKGVVSLRGRRTMNSTAWKCFVSTSAPPVMTQVM